MQLQQKTRYTTTLPAPEAEPIGIEAHAFACILGLSLCLVLGALVWHARSAPPAQAPAQLTSTPAQLSPAPTQSTSAQAPSTWTSASHAQPAPATLAIEPSTRRATTRPIPISSPHPTSSRPPSEEPMTAQFASVQPAFASYSTNLPQATPSLTTEPATGRNLGKSVSAGEAITKAELLQRYPDLSPYLEARDFGEVPNEVQSRIDKQVDEMQHGSLGKYD